jgi:hypothetical protein
MISKNIIPLWPALVATILPDLTDKVVTDYLHWMPYGRNYLLMLRTAILSLTKHRLTSLYITI